MEGLTYVGLYLSAVVVSSLSSPSSPPSQSTCSWHLAVSAHAVMRVVGGSLPLISGRHSKMAEPSSVTRMLQHKCRSDCLRPSRPPAAAQQLGAKRRGAAKWSQARRGRCGSMTMASRSFPRTNYFSQYFIVVRIVTSALILAMGLTAGVRAHHYRPSGV